MPLLFMLELRVFSYLAYTYILCIAVKSFFNLNAVKKLKFEKQALGCAIYMKEYTIMMYLSNQIHYVI